MCKKKGREWQSRYIPICLNSSSFIWCNLMQPWHKMKRGKFKFDMFLFWNFHFWVSHLVFLPFFTHFLYLPYTNPLLVAHLNALLSAFTLGRIMCKCQKWICILKMNWNSMTQKTKIFWKSLNFWHEKSLQFTWSGPCI